MGFLWRVRRWWNRDKIAARREWGVRLMTEYQSLLPVKLFDSGRAVFLDVVRGLTIEAGSFEEAEAKYMASLAAFSGGPNVVPD